MSWRSIRRRLERLEHLENSVVPIDLNETPEQHLVRIYGFESLFRPTTDEACAALEDLLRQSELDCDPPDSIDRLLARRMAKLDRQPDPYGTDGMSEAERRASDWSDYHEKEKLRRKGLAQEVVRLPDGLRELPASDTKRNGNREREREQVA
jgi:hypothetical protein